RGILDGHIILSRKLASRGHYPAIDVLQSISRVMPDIVDKQRMKLAQRAREVLATFAEVEDLLTIGAYKEGQNPRADFAVSHIEGVWEFLRQTPEESVPSKECLVQLAKAVGEPVQLQQQQQQTAVQQPRPAPTAATLR
ncbi:MAG: hypothetical protein KDD44_12580, partial [Bdellovibrionales bacterium]|nr:hypothetical protein [Bdellovibrionales bacterium]